MQSPIPPSFIYWYKGKRLMNYSQRGGISVITERTTRTSKLLISKATPTDSGNYTCSPSSSGKISKNNWHPLPFWEQFRICRLFYFLPDSASVVVHVINGEHPAAMQHGNNSASTLAPSYRRVLRHRRPSSDGGVVTTFANNISTLYSILWSIIDFMIATNCCLVFFGIALSQRLLHTSGGLSPHLPR